MAKLRFQRNHFLIKLENIATNFGVLRLRDLIYSPHFKWNVFTYTLAADNHVWTRL